MHFNGLGGKFDGDWSVVVIMDGAARRSVRRERRCPICRDNWKARVRNERQEVIPVIHASFRVPRSELMQ